MKNVCIFGASCSNIDEAYLRGAYRVGELLAKNGFGLVFGGGDMGLMGQAARGARAGGGRITGVIPEKLHRPGVAFAGCDELIVTPDMHTRKAEMERLSSGFIALPGGFGTIEELMEVLTLNQLGYLSSPVIILNINGYFDYLIGQLSVCIAQGFTSPACAEIYAVASTPEEALTLLLDHRAPVLPDKIKDALEFARGEKNI